MFITQFFNRASPRNPLSRKALVTARKAHYIQEAFPERPRNPLSRKALVTLGHAYEVADLLARPRNPLSRKALVTPLGLSRQQ